MGDFKKDGQIYKWYCGRCGREIDSKKLHIRLPVANLFGDKQDFILICGECGKQLFPLTSVFDREDCE